MSQHNALPFILASASPRRLSLLQDIGCPPHLIEAADIDETPATGEHPRDLAQRLAYEKGALIAAKRPDAVVLAGDTVVACGRRVLPKARDEDDVRRFLALMSGRRHHVYTAICAFGPQAEGNCLQKLSDSTVIFKRLSAHEINAYAATGEGIGKAGGYAIQGAAAALVRYISGSYSGIVGLPLFETAQILKKLGVMS